MFKRGERGGGDRRMLTIWQHGRVRPKQILYATFWNHDKTTKLILSTKTC